MYSSILLGLTAVHGARAWGNLGHETVAYVATNFVQSGTESWAQDILGDTSTSYLANVATWADSFRYTSGGRWSAPYHFIDANDDPPNSCNVDYERDCVGTGCVVSAIANYTNRVQSTSLSDSEVQIALKFIIHFVGDITQPLHDEAYELGGNDVDVTFNGDDTELHAVWDTNIPEELRGGYSLSDAKSWASDITTAIKSGQYKSQAASWLNGLDVNDVRSSAMTWATDANAFVCSVVMPDGTDVLQNGDLYPDYYDSVVDTIQLQIAKAGYRLAKWLDAIAANAQTKRDVQQVRSGVEKRAEVEEDLMGDSLLPPPRELTPAQRRRAAVGWGCNHEH